MKTTTKMKHLLIKSRILTVIDVPLALLAIPHIYLQKRIYRIANRLCRLEFVSRGMCGGCDRFGKKNCHTHSKNPYAVVGKGCLTVEGKQVNV